MLTATVNILRWSGSSASPTKTNITNLNTRATTSDSDAQTGSPTTNPIPVPGSGSNYSYWITTRLNCSVAPATEIQNILWYTSGSNPFPSGVTCQVATVPLADAYVQATGTPGITGTQLLSANYSGLTPSPPLDAFANYTSSTPLTVNGSTTGTGDFGDYVVYQITVASTCTTPGPTPQATFTFQYDET